MRYIIIIISVILATTGVFAQNNVGIGTTSPNPDAILDLTSTNKGLLLPRLTAGDTAALSNPANAGMLIFSNTDRVFQFYDGTRWQSISFGDPNPWGSTGNNIYNLNSGNVGIGTANPNYLLDIWGSDGTVDGSSGVWARIINQVSGTGPVSAGIVFDAYNNLLSGTKGGIFFRRTGGFGVGELVFSTNNNADVSNIDASDAFVRMTIKEDGRVGIGTINPNAIYKTTISSDLEGGLRIDHLYSGGAAQYGIFNNVQPNGAGTVFGNYVAFANTGTGVRFGTYQEIYAEAANGSSAYGTVNHMRAEGSGQAQGFRAELFGSGSGTNYGLYVFNSPLGSGTEYGVYATGEDYNYFDGNVGIGITTPGNELTVAGSGVIGAGIAASATPQSNGLIVEENVGIGYTTASDAYQLRVDIPTTNTTTYYGIYSLNGYNGAISKYGVFGYSTVEGTGNKYGGYFRADQPAGEASAAYGTYSYLNHDGTGDAYGNYVNAGPSTTSGTSYGLYTTGEEMNYMSSRLGINTTNQTYRLYVNGDASDGASNALFFSNDTWGTAVNISAGGGGSAYQIVAAGSAHPTLNPGSFAISNFATGDLFVIDGTSGDITLGESSATTANKIGLGIAPTGSSKVYIRNDDNSFLDGLWVQNDKTSGTTYGIYQTASNTSSSTVYGVRAYAGGGSGTRYGVYGSTGGSGTRYGLYCSGNGGYTGSWSNVSDMNLKKNIRNYDNALDKVVQLEPKRYEYKTDEKSYMDLAQGDQIGLIAQEVQVLFPEVVTQNIHPGPVDDNGRPTGQEESYLGIDYIKLVPILTQAIKEQQELIEQLQLEVAELKGK